MQLIFLGTGPALAIPRQSCRCVTCQTARQSLSHSARARSSLLVLTAGQQILFDVGPDIENQLKSAGSPLIDAALITHAHHDAVGGLVKLSHHLNYKKHQAILLIEKNSWKRVRGDRGMIQPWIKIRFIKPGQTIRFKKILITPFRVKHSLTPGFPTLGFRINQSVVYASDVSQIPKISEQYVRRIPHLILDGCIWFGKKIKSHLTVDQSIAIAQKLKIGHLYLTQISHTYPPHEKASRLIRAYCQKQKITLPVTLVYDGLKLNVS